MEICLIVLMGCCRLDCLQMTLHCMLWSGVWRGIEGGGKALHKLVGEFGGWLWNCVDSATCVVTLVILGSAISLEVSFKHLNYWALHFLIP
jgi:hypothetical protein